MSKVKYLHYRAFDKDGTVSPRRGATVAYKLYPDYSLRFAVARVHHKDNFSRATGRDVSTHRLEALERQCFFIGGPQYDSTSGNYSRDVAFRNYMDELMFNSHHYKRRARAR